jgi:GNAT superfamily N-acetyltransferase
MRESDLPAADHIMRLAFGTFLGLPEPSAFLGDAGYVKTRWRADPGAAFAAELGGELVGSNLATNWGSVGFFGPLSVHPELWNRGVAQSLMAPVMDCFARWGTVNAGLFTFPQSVKHVGLYQRFGFLPRFLTAVLAKPIAAATARTPWTASSSLPEPERRDALARCRALTDAVYAGLDVSLEIGAVAEQQLGDTLLLEEDSGLAGIAVCHVGAGTEAGSGACYVKFAAVRPGAQAPRRFAQLLDACETFAAERGLARLVAGVNTARSAAYRQMLERGFRTQLRAWRCSAPTSLATTAPTCS